MKTLGVCGDSWMAATVDAPGKHHGEILAKKLNYKHYTLARGAVSNLCIRLQLEQMVQDRPDFILVGTTSTSRIDFAIGEDSFTKEFSGIFDYVYTNHPDVSSEDPRFTKGKKSLISETLNNMYSQGELVDDCLDKRHLTPELLQAVKYYITYLHNQYLATVRDSCILSDMITLLNDSKIPYLLFDHITMGKSLSTIKKSKRIIQTGNKLSPHSFIDHASTRRFHTDDESQETVAENLYDYLISNDLL